MSYNQQSGYERARVESKATEYENDLSSADAELKLLESEDEALGSRAALLRKKLAAAERSPEAGRHDAGSETDEDGLERELKSVLEKMGQNAEHRSLTSLKRSRAKSGLRELERLVGNRLTHDVALKEKLVETEAGVRHYTAEISAENPAAKSIGYGVADTTYEQGQKVTDDVAQGRALREHLQRAYSGTSHGSTTDGHIDQKQIYPSTEARSSGLESIVWRLDPEVRNGARQSSHMQRYVFPEGEYSPTQPAVTNLLGDESHNPTLQAGSSILEQGVEALQQRYLRLRDGVGDSSSVSPGLLAERPDLPPLQYVHFLKKANEVAVDATKSTAKSVIDYVGKTTRYSASLLGSIFGGGR